VNKSAFLLIALRRKTRIEMTMNETTGATDALFAQYAAGQLRGPAHALVAAHLELKAGNRAYVAALENLAAKDMDAIAPVELANRDARLDAIFNSTLAPVAAERTKSIIPRALQRYANVDVADIPWKSVIPGFKEWDLGIEDGCEINMFWIKEGRKMPTHTHEGSELFLVLDGSFEDESGVYGAGDISVADENVNHRPIAGKDRPCIGFSVTDAPLRLTGSLSEKIGMFFGH
jgi:putative transcriptional regulator